MEGIPAVVQPMPGRIEEWSADRLLQFRDEWVRNRARDIRKEASIAFRFCSEDSASITALNEFYRWRTVDGHAHLSEKGHLVQ